ncbi:MAG: serine protease [Lachnospiraceae bacterium]|nr:serine protease [Lachnospiraceae bacterium]
MKKYLIMSLCVLLLITGCRKHGDSYEIQHKKPEYPVYRVECDDRFGVAFGICYEDKEYTVTAMHVTKGNPALFIDSKGHEIEADIFHAPQIEAKKDALDLDGTDALSELDADERVDGSLQGDVTKADNDGSIGATDNGSVDVAVYGKTFDDIPFFEVSPLDFDKLFPGDECYCINDKSERIKGKIEDKIVEIIDMGTQMTLADLKVGDGFSGAPVLNSNDKVVGMVIGFNDEGQCAILPISIIIGYLKDL